MTSKRNCILLFLIVMCASSPAYCYVWYDWDSGDWVYYNNYWDDWGDWNNWDYWNYWNNWYYYPSDTPHPTSPNSTNQVQSQPPQVHNNSTNQTQSQPPQIHNNWQDFGNWSGQSALPNRSICGLQDVVTRRDSKLRVSNGVEGVIGEFPWLVVLVYRNKSSGVVNSFCEGTLISARYVLTAAHCVFGEILKELEIAGIILGEHDIRTDKDCRGFLNCNDNPFVVERGQIIVHPGYNANDKNRHNDIALIRLERDAPSSKFIKPICLPDASEVTTSKSRMFVAGWGQTEKLDQSPVKVVGAVPLVNISDCQEQYKKLDEGVSLGQKQICAGGGNKKIVACENDGGAPLLTTFRKNTNQWYVDGVFSFGRGCGAGADNGGVPGVFTRVLDYLNWIKLNVR